MKTTLRTIICILLALCMLVPLTACNAEYRDDIPAVTVCHAVVNELPLGKASSKVNKNFINGSDWGEDFLDYLDLTAEHYILISSESDVNIDEVGVFVVAKSSDVKAVKGFVEDYVAAKKVRMKSLLESYNTAELPKLDHAEVKVCGNYVMYTILNAADTATAQAAFEAVLTPEG